MQGISFGGVILEVTWAAAREPRFGSVVRLHGSRDINNRFRLWGSGPGIRGSPQHRSHLIGSRSNLIPVSDEVRAPIGLTGWLVADV
jgi:hypothetical protein